jgi:hypothetical protein
MIWKLCYLERKSCLCIHSRYFNLSFSFKIIPKMDSPLLKNSLSISKTMKNFQRETKICIHLIVLVIKHILFWKGQDIECLWNRCVSDVYMFFEKKKNEKCCNPQRKVLCIKKNHSQKKKFLQRNFILLQKIFFAKSTKDK